MSEAVNETLSNLRDHVPPLPKATDVRDAVQSHLPSVDIDAVRDKAKSKRSLVVMIVGMIAAAAAIIGYAKRR